MENVINTEIKTDKPSKSYIVSYDHLLLASYLVLCLIGLFVSLDINSVRSGLQFFYRHLIFLGAATAVMYLTFRFKNLIKLRKWIFVGMLVVIVLLVLVLIIGSAVKGATRSIRIGPINLQPSLLARIFMVFYFAHILDKKKDLLPQSGPKGFVKHFKSLIIMPVLIFGLILAERHLSPLIISGVTLLGMMWVARVRLTTILVILLILAVGATTVIAFGAKYRSSRMDIFEKYSLYHRAFGDKEASLKNVEGDYQVRESLTALTSGKLIGVGPENGLAKHYYLPETRTDYIFSIIGEEFGYLGALVVLLLFSLLFYRSMTSSWLQEDFFLKMVGIGLSLNIFVNAMVNIGVAMSALPSTGVTLPFVSYGGTSLVVNSFSIGVLLNISAKRRQVW